jgi:hypothetical protein
MQTLNVGIKHSDSHIKRNVRRVQYILCPDNILFLLYELFKGTVARD